MKSCVSKAATNCVVSILGSLIQGVCQAVSQLACARSEALCRAGSRSHASDLQCLSSPPTQCALLFPGLARSTLPCSNCKVQADEQWAACVLPAPVLLAKSSLLTWHPHRQELCDYIVGDPESCLPARCASLGEVWCFGWAVWVQCCLLEHPACRGSACWWWAYSAESSLISINAKLRLWYLLVL